MPLKKLSTRKKKKFIKQVEDTIIRICEEVSLPPVEVVSSTVKSLIRTGFSQDQILEIYEVAYLDNGCSCNPIGIGYLKKFIIRFLGINFAEGHLSSAINQARDIFARSNKYCYCGESLVKRSLKISEENEVYDLNEVQDILVRDFYRDPDDQRQLGFGVVMSDEEPAWNDELLETQPPVSRSFPYLHPDDVCHPVDPDQDEFERENYG